MISLRLATLHERRIARRLEARGETGQAERLLGLKGVVVGERHRVESLYAVGGEGAVYLTRDTREPARTAVAKVALLPVHRPFELGADLIRRQREALRVEARFLADSGSTFLPGFRGLFEFTNPLLDAARGDAFAEPEPLLLMEKLPGRDLDRWLARMHRSDMPRVHMRRTLDRVAVVLLQALVDLFDRGFLYADLRPGNLRMMGRPERRIRLLDAGSLVSRNDRTGRFPHVPAYLPPVVFSAISAGHRIAPSGETQAVMAGRTLYEVATGRVPRPGEDVDMTELAQCNVSPQVAEVVEGLCRGDFRHVRHALRFLSKRARRRVTRGNAPRRAAAPLNGKPAPAPAPQPALQLEPTTPPSTPGPSPGPAAKPTAPPPSPPSPPSPRSPRSPPSDASLPRRRLRGLLARLLGRLLRR